MQTVSGKRQHTILGVVAGSIFAGSVAALAAAPAYATTVTVHSGSAYGAEVNVGSAVKLGQVAVAQLPSCYTQAVGSKSASVASVNKSGLVSTGLVDSTASSTATSSTGTSDVLGVNLLNGLISSTEIKAVSTSTVTNGVFSFNTTGSDVGNLTVLGVRIPITVAPNTTIALPLLGSVVLNEQSSYVSADQASLTVNMIHVKITLGSSKGTEIIVAHANSSIKTQSSPGVVGGYAYAPRLSTGLVTSGPIVQENIPCFGTGGAILTDSIAATSLPGIVDTGTVTVTGTGNVTRSKSSSQATSSIAGANLLSGLLSATAINGVASAYTTDGVNFEFSGSSTFAGLSVAGHPEISVDVAPNTAIPILNLGTLYLNKVITSSNKIQVLPVELVVNTSNSLGLPIGAILTLGATEAQLHSAVIP